MTKHTFWTSTKILAPSCDLDLKSLNYTGLIYRARAKEYLKRSSYRILEHMCPLIKKEKSIHLRLTFISVHV